MSTFKSQIPRDVAARLGHEAVAIAKSGEYHVAAGVKVSIRARIDHAVQGTISYPPDEKIIAAQVENSETVIEVENETTLSAGRRLLQAGLNPVILNFASATSPGGGFLDGARAQEEYLARSSSLYACIRTSPMYTFHRAYYDPLYSDYLIYSPGVPIIRDDNGNLLERPYTISMITCAAVNANKLPSHRRQEIGPAMWQRILKVLAVGMAHRHDSIVLGAWGCGAFGNDGSEIARLFHKGLAENFAGAYRRVIFAIVDWSPNRIFINPFIEEFKPNARRG